MVLPFKRNLFGRILTQYCLFLRILRKEIWNFLGISTLLSFHSLALVRPYDTFLLMTFM